MKQPPRAVERRAMGMLLATRLFMAGRATPSPSPTIPLASITAGRVSPAAATCSNDNNALLILPFARNKQLASTAQHHSLKQKAGKTTSDTSSAYCTLVCRSWDLLQTSTSHWYPTGTCTDVHIRGGPECDQK